jgi:chemotaxis protein CheD
VTESKPKLLVAGVGEWISSADPAAVLATYALGSCIGLVAYDPVKRIGGLLHFMLPDSKLNPERARTRPGTFCDTGLPLLLKELESLGARRERLMVYMAGAASVLENRDFFDIGRNNALTAKRILWSLGLMVEDEETGGERSRTLKLALELGRVTVHDSIGERELGARALRRF